MAPLSMMGICDENLTLFENVWDELLQTTTPCQPFMMCAGRLVEIYIDANSTKVLGKFFCSKVLFAATAEEQVVYLLVELCGIGEYAIVALLHVKSENGSAEGSHPSEFVHVGKNEVESLVTTP